MNFITVRNYDTKEDCIINLDKVLFISIKNNDLYDIIFFFDWYITYILSAQNGVCASAGFNEIKIGSIGQ